ncbi:hypothetical protein IMZ68_03085 [Candidatus Bathyarchaeota archaeon]|nr:hypothetical protein [Candidatus Bathyarchaeota archaeon]MBE3141450.1 hypothetical protein [Thermoplasmata archaeon]
MKKILEQILELTQHDYNGNDYAHRLSLIADLCATALEGGQLEQRARRLFYFGTYGLMVDPIEMETEKAEWLDKRLKEHIKEHLVVGWATQRMKILADMLEDRRQPYFADEIRKIMAEMVKQSA